MATAKGRGMLASIIKTMITEYENSLRRIILLILEDKINNYRISPERITIWTEKREIARKKFKETLREERLIYYSDFYDLKNIINKNWEKFLPILLHKKRFEIFYEEMELYRNEVSHGRDLTTSQMNLMNGIVNDLKTLITIYHNKNQMKDDYFIKILKISDNIGNVWEESKTLKSIVLREGDYYELIIEAFDPKGREIHYKIYTLNGFKVSQVSNKFSFSIDKSMISKSVILTIIAFTPISEYNNSDIQLLNYTILPI